MYRRYASLFFICGTDGQEVSLATEQLSGTRRVRVSAVRTCGAVGSSAAGIREWGEASAACAARCSHRAPPGTAIPRPQNNLAILELIHTLVETLDRYFENVVRVRSATAAPRALAHRVRPRPALAAQSGPPPGFLRQTHSCMHGDQQPARSRCFCTVVACD